MLDAEGWAELAPVRDFLASRLGRPVAAGELRGWLLGNPRFELAPGADRIRARYGHSRVLELSPAAHAIVDPGLLARKDPCLLHGTSVSAARAILGGGEGLIPRSRRRVALTRAACAPDAFRVARRHRPGPWTVLAASVRAAAELGTVFYETGAAVIEASAIPAAALAPIVVFGAPPQECSRLLTELEGAIPDRAEWKNARAQVRAVLAAEGMSR